MKAEKLVASFKSEGWNLDIYEQLFELAANNPDDVYEFASLFLDNFSKNYTIFNDSLSYITKQHFSLLIAKAIKILKTTENECAENIIEHACLQFPDLLNDYLEIIFELKLNWSTYYSSYPWRGADKNQVKLSKEKFFNSETSTDDKKELFGCLLQTRDIDIINEIYKYTLDNNLFNRPDIEQYLDYYLEDVGYTRRNGKIVSYCLYRTYHFSFKPDYFDDSDRKIFLSRKQHPTWCIQPEIEKYRFGGMLEEDEINPLFHFITFDTIPNGININGLEKLTLACHVRELNEWCMVFYQHDENGYPVKINTRTDCKIDYPFDNAIKETFVQLAPTPARWKFQSWGSSNSRENLFRLGGEPTWIQGADVLVCPICGEKMDFLMQLDTDLPDVKDSELMFGSGGICYVFWCDKTKVSGYIMQCT